VIRFSPAWRKAHYSSGYRLTDIDRHTVVIFATADVVEASTFVTAVTQHFSAHYRVFSGVEKDSP
jgi:hypothetical protein